MVRNASYGAVIFTVTGSGLRAVRPRQLVIGKFHSFSLESQDCKLDIIILRWYFKLGFFSVTFYIFSLSLHITLTRLSSQIIWLVATIDEDCCASYPSKELGADKDLFIVATLGVPPVRLQDTDLFKCWIPFPTT